MSVVIIMKFVTNKKMLYVITNLILIIFFGITYWGIDVLTHKSPYFSKLLKK